MKRIFNIFLLMIVGVFGIQAQQVNRLYLQDVNAIKGKTVSLPVFMENTSSKIVAMQFDVGVPYNVSINTGQGVMAESRYVDHVARVDYCPESYSGYSNLQFFRVMVFSPSNTPFKANDGQVLTLEMPLSESIEEEVDYQTSEK